MTTTPPDQFERDLSAMTEARAGDERTPTELWKRALEVSRAEERAAIVHPGHAEHDARAPRGRRLLIGLNAVGVAALVLLTVGVWTIAVRAPSPTDELRGAASSARQAQPSDGDNARAEEPSTPTMGTMPAIEPAPSMPEGARAKAEESFMSSENTLADSAPIADADRAGEREALARNRRDPSLDEANEIFRDSLRARDRTALLEGGAREEEALESDAFADDGALTRAVVPSGDPPPGLEQMAMAPEMGLELNDGRAGLMARRAGPEIPIENAHITIEADDADDAVMAFVAASEIPNDRFMEYSSLGGEPSAGTRELYLNVSPARTDDVLRKLRGLGKVESESREPDTLGQRAAEAATDVSRELGPLRAEIESLGLEPWMNDHQRAHIISKIDTEDFVRRVQDVVTEMSRRLEDVSRSADLTRIRVTIQTPTEKTLGENEPE